MKKKARTVQSSFSSSPELSVRSGQLYGTVRICRMHRVVASSIFRCGRYELVHLPTGRERILFRRELA